MIARLPLIVLAALTMSSTAYAETLAEKIENKFCKPAVIAVAGYKGSQGKTSAEGKKLAIARWHHYAKAKYGAGYGRFWLAADKKWTFEEGGDIDANHWRISARPCSPLPLPAPAPIPK